MHYTPCLYHFFDRTFLSVIDAAYSKAAWTPQPTPDTQGKKDVYTRTKCCVSSSILFIVHNDINLYESKYEILCKDETWTIFIQHCFV